MDLGAVISFVLMVFSIVMFFRSLAKDRARQYFVENFSARIADGSIITVPLLFQGIPDHEKGRARALAQADINRWALRQTSTPFQESDYNNLERILGVERSIKPITVISIIA